jgi:cell volume regulation protein A
VIKEVWITIVLIATVGVVITAVITSVAAYWILGVILMTILIQAPTTR